MALHQLTPGADALARRLGGRERARIILLLASVVGLEMADTGAVGAVAGQIERAFHVGHTELGLVASVSLLVGALGTLPFGMLADRVRRVRVLSVVVTLWGVAMIATGAAQSYTWLLLARLGLGALTAAAMPLVASLIGDYFPSEERARIYGYVLTGEYLGTAFGLLVSGNLAAATSWRYAFWVLVIPGLVLAWLLHRRLPEPDRSRPDDVERSLPRAVRRVLAVRTNVILIVASALGYFFFAGLRTFAVSFLRGRFALSQPVATSLLVLLGVGALFGVLAGGRLADRLARRGREDARIVVPAAGYALGALVLLPGFLTTSLPLALLSFVGGGILLSVPNAPLDAARLDIIPASLWGRAESVRTVLRQSAQAGAPLLFGVVAEALGGAGGEHVGGPGLRYAFLIMLVSLVASAAVVWRARRHYQADCARAIESDT
jgi:MFS family permease